MDLGYSAEERNAILGSDPEQMRLSTSESVESPTGTLSSFSGEPGARPVSLAEFVEGLRAMVSIMSPERLARFDTNVDMVGDVVEPDFFAPLADPNDPADTSAHGQYDSSHSLPNGDEDAGQNSLSFARVALRRASARPSRRTRARTQTYTHTHVCQLCSSSSPFPSLWPSLSSFYPSPFLSNFLFFSSILATKRLILHCCS